MFPATLNKRGQTKKIIINETNNVSGRFHEIYLALSSGNGAGK